MKAAITPTPTTAASRPSRPWIPEIAVSSLPGGFWDHRQQFHRRNPATSRDWTCVKLRHRSGKPRRHRCRMACDGSCPADTKRSALPGSEYRGRFDQHQDLGSPRTRSDRGDPLHNFIQAHAATLAPNDIQGPSRSYSGVEPNASGRRGAGNGVTGPAFYLTEFSVVAALSVREGPRVLALVTFGPTTLRRLS